MVAQSNSYNVYYLLKSWDRCFEFHSPHGYISASFLCWRCPVWVETLLQVDPPSKEIYQMSIKKSPKPRKRYSLDSTGLSCHTRRT
jgi:hypothetical protein